MHLLHRGNSSQVDLPSHEKIIESAALVLVLVSSSILNISTCWIIARNRTLRSRPANIFVANLCLSNLLLTLFVLPFSLATIIWDKHDAYPGPACTVNGFLSVVSCTAIVLTLCCISIDRYIAVNKSTRYRTILTPKRSCYMLSFTWFQALLFASFPVLGWSYYEYHPGTLHCSPSYSADCSLYMFLSAAGFGIPVVVMIITYIRIFQVIRKHSRTIASLKLPSRNPSCVRSQVRAKQVNDTELHCHNTSSSLIDFHNEKNETLSRYNSCPLSPSSIITTNQDEHTSYLVTQDYVEARDNDAMTLNKENNPAVSLSLEVAHLFQVDKNVNKSIEDVHCLTSPSTSNAKPRIHIRNTKKRLKKLQLNFRFRKSALNERRLPKEYKVAKTGLLLLVVFLVLWLPYLVVNSCSNRVNASERVFHFAMLLVYMNGVANPIAYTFNNNIVKMKFKQMFCWACQPICNR